MFQLLVYYNGSDIVRETVSAGRASEVLELIPTLLAKHDGCEHIVVTLNGARLFAVDCHGKRLP